MNGVFLVFQPSVSSFFYILVRNTIDAHLLPCAPAASFLLHIFSFSFSRNSFSSSVITSQFFCRSFLFLSAYVIGRFT